MKTYFLCVSGVFNTIQKEKVIYSQLLIIVTKVILHVPNFNQYHFVTVNAYPNRKIKQVSHLPILDMLLTLLPVYGDN